MRMPEHPDRQFAAKVNCFNAGYEKVKELDYDIIGNLDADISFDQDYFEFLMANLPKTQSLVSQGHRLLKMEIITTTGLQILSMSQEPANCSGENVLKKLGDMFRSKVAESIGLL